MGIRYHDVEIELDRCCCHQAEIRILESTFDRPRARFRLGDRQRAALAAKVEEFESLLVQGAKHASRRRQLAEKIGVHLYQALLPGALGRTFERCHAALRPGEGLRLRLSFGREYDRQLGSLPWELLCDPEKRRFIGVEKTSPVVRYLDLGEKIQPLDVTPPLKVLGFIAAPDPAASERYSYCEIDAEAHRAILEEAIGPARFVQVRCFPRQGESSRAALAALRDELVEAERAGAPYHVLHFVGHGGFDAEGEGALFFDRNEGGEHLVTGRELARQLTEDLRLIVLASCNTGKIPLVRRNGQHPFAGVASALVAAGKPAVVAMQFSVSEEAAKAFAGPFYRAIDADESIDVAVTEGRLAIDARGEEGDLEWATPVLFLRSPDGRILNLKDGVPPKTVAIFNVLDLGKEKMRHVDFEVDLRDHFKRGDGEPRVSSEWNDAIMRDLRATLLGKLPATSPIRLELAAPLSVAFACGFLLPVNERRSIAVRQGEEVWTFDGHPPLGATFWLSDAAARELIPPGFPFAGDSDDIAVVVEGARPAIDAVSDYLKREDIEPSPPRVGALVYARFDRASQYSIRGGAHARCLAEELVARVDAVASGRGYPTIHFFLAGPNGLAVAIGRLCHLLPRIQLYEFDKEKRHHKTYEPSITLVPPRMGETP